MTDRDKELDEEIKDALKGEQTPKLEEPENRGIGDGTSCFMNVDRMCASDCRAYDFKHDDPESPDVCTILSSMKTMGVNLEKLVSAAGMLKKMNQDRQRTPEQPPPDPTGKRKPG